MNDLNIVLLTYKSPNNRKKESFAIRKIVFQQMVTQIEFYLNSLRAVKFHAIFQLLRRMINMIAFCKRIPNQTKTGT